jgi:hypothetical protein
MIIQDTSTIGLIKDYKDLTFGCALAMGSCERRIKEIPTDPSFNKKSTKLSKLNKAYAIRTITIHYNDYQYNQLMKGK